MNALGRSALLITTGDAGLSWTLALDTWKPGRVPIGWLLLLAVVILGIGIVDLVRAAASDSVSAVRNSGWVRLGVFGMSGTTILA